MSLFLDRISVPLIAIRVSIVWGLFFHSWLACCKTFMGTVSLLVHQQCLSIISFSFSLLLLLLFSWIISYRILQFYPYFISNRKSLYLLVLLTILFEIVSSVWNEKDIRLIANKIIKFIIKRQIFSPNTFTSHALFISEFLVISIILFLYLYSAYFIIFSSICIP